MTATEVALDGTPHWPAIAKVRVPACARAGPPYGPAGPRVSRIRQGVNVKNFAAGAGVAVAVNVRVRVGVRVFVRVGVGVNVAVRVGVLVGGAGVNVAVAVGVGVGVGLAVNVKVRVGERVEVRVGLLVKVAVNVRVRVGVSVKVGVLVKVRVAVFVGVGVGSGGTVYWKRFAHVDVVQAVQPKNEQLLPKSSGPVVESHALTMYLTVVPPGWAGIVASTTSTVCPPCETSTKVQE